MSQYRACKLSVLSKIPPFKAKETTAATKIRQLLTSFALSLYPFTTLTPKLNVSVCLECNCIVMQNLSQIRRNSYNTVPAHVFQLMLLFDWLMHWLINWLAGNVQALLVFAFTVTGDYLKVSEEKQQHETKPSAKKPFKAALNWLLL